MPTLLCRQENLVAYSTPHSVTCGIRDYDISAPMVTDGAMTGALFLKYVQEFLCPTLHPGDLVIADNLRSHKVTEVKKALEAVGARIRYLPPYSPDRNPIEQLFAKLKALLRKAAPRTGDALWKDIGTRLDRASPPTNAPATSRPQTM